MIDPKLKLVAGDAIYARLFVSRTCMPGEETICLAASVGDNATIQVTREVATMATTVLHPGDEVAFIGPSRGPGIVQHLIDDQAWVRWSDGDQVAPVNCLVRTRTAVQVLVEDGIPGAETLMAAE